MKPPEDRLAAGGWQQAVDLLILIAASCLLLAASFQVGRDYERINALAAEPTVPVRVVGKEAARAKLQRAAGRRQQAAEPRSSASCQLPPAS
jgi:hypothetical protein